MRSCVFDVGERASRARPRRSIRSRSRGGLRLLNKFHDAREERNTRYDVFGSPCMYSCAVTFAEGRRSCEVLRHEIAHMHTLCALVAWSYVCIAPCNLQLAPFPSSSSSSITSSSSNSTRVAATLAGGRWNSRDVQSFGDEHASCTSQSNVRKPVMDSSGPFPSGKTIGRESRFCRTSRTIDIP